MGTGLDWQIRVGREVGRAGGVAAVENVSILSG